MIRMHHNSSMAERWHFCGLYSGSESVRMNWYMLWFWYTPYNGCDVRYLSTVLGIASL